LSGRNGNLATENNTLIFFYAFFYKGFTFLLFMSTPATSHWYDFLFRKLAKPPAAFVPPTKPATAGAPVTTPAIAALTSNITAIATKVDNIVSWAEKLNSTLIQPIIKKYDTNGNGRLDPAEWRTMLANKDFWGLILIVVIIPLLEGFMEVIGSLYSPGTGGPWSTLWIVLRIVIYPGVIAWIRKWASADNIKIQKDYEAEKAAHDADKKDWEQKEKLYILGIHMQAGYMQMFMPPDRLPQDPTFNNPVLEATLAPKKPVVVSPPQPAPITPVVAPAVVMAPPQPITPVVVPVETPPPAPDPVSETPPVEDSSPPADQ
jgi:hypothetical protein